MENPSSPTQVFSPVKITQSKLIEALQDALRAEIGAGKRHTITSGAEAITCSEAPLRDYLGGESTPGLKTFLNMCAAFGPGFTNRILALAGYGNAERINPTPVNEFELNCEASKLVAALGDALKDGRVDHREKPVILRAVPHLVEMLKSYQQRGCLPLKI